MSEPRPLPRNIRSDRLVLTAVGPDDADDQVVAVNASLPELMAWMPWCKGPLTPEAARENLVQGVAEFDEGSNFNWVIRVAQTGAYAGRIGVHRLGWAVPKGEIGYWLATPHTGKGYVREAVDALLEALWEAGFRRVEIRCDAKNERSAAVPRALGFTLDATLVHDDVSATDPTVLRDTLVFSQVR